MSALEILFWPIWRDTALGVAGAVLLSWMLERCSQSPVWRRSVWQACFVAIALMMGLELTGLGQGLARAVSQIWYSGKSTNASNSSAGPFAGLVAGQLEEESLPLSFAEQEDSFESTNLFFQNASATSEMEPVSPLLARTSAPSLAKEPSSFPKDRLAGVFWIWVLWVGGTVLMALRLVGSILWTAWLAKRSHPVMNPVLGQTVDEIAARLKTGPPSGLLASPQLLGPVSFGWWRPVILLPEDFERRFSPDQQRAVLAHEMAHLAGRDPGWIGLAECLLALLWWHPLAWHAKSRLRLRTEEAADEASLLMPGGPAVLAECLVHLGKRMAARPVILWTGLGAQGFKSSLGRRVEQLLKLAAVPRPWAARKGFFFRRMSVTTLILAGFVTGEAWPVQNFSAKGNTMSLIQQSWKQSAAAALVALAVGVNEPASLPAAEPAGTSPLQPVPVERSGEQPENSAPLSREEMLEALRNITIDHISVSNAPLPDALKALNGEISQKTPRHRPVNFLIKRNPWGTPEPPSVEWTGDDPKRAAIDQLSVRQVNLSDLLDLFVSTANQPLAWRLEDYGIVISPPGPDEPETQRAYAGMSPELLKRYGIVPPPASAALSARNQNQPQREAARNRVRRMLMNTQTDSIEADAASLPVFLRLLSEDFNSKNPGEPALNFVLGKKASALEALPGPAPYNATITIKPALHGLRYSDFITMLTGMSSIPLAYSVEPYGVLFTPSLRKTTPASSSLKSDSNPGNKVIPHMSAKAFRLRATFLKELQQTFGVNVPDTTLSADAGKKVKAALSSLSERLGIALLDPEKQVFFNHMSMALMIRAPDQELAILEAALLTVGGSALGNKALVEESKPDATSR